MIKLGFPIYSVFKDAFGHKYQKAQLIEAKIMKDV